MRSPMQKPPLVVFGVDGSRSPLHDVFKKAPNSAVSGPTRNRSNLCLQQRNKEALSVKQVNTVLVGMVEQRIWQEITDQQFKHWTPLSCLPCKGVRMEWRISLAQM